MKGCVQWNSVYDGDFASSWDRNRSARSVGQRVGVGRFRILGGGGAKFRILGGGGKGGAKFPEGT